MSIQTYNHTNTHKTLQFPAHCDDDYLLVYSDTHLDVFDIKSADWIQSIGLKKPRPLSNEGNLSLMMMNESPYVVYMANMRSRELLDTDAVERSMPRRRFSLRESSRIRTAATDRRSKMISAPTNFNHVSRKLNINRHDSTQTSIQLFSQTWAQEYSRNSSIFPRPSKQPTMLSRSVQIFAQRRRGHKLCRRKAAFAKA